MNYIECPEEYNNLWSATRGNSVFLGGGITSCPQWQPVMAELLSKSDLTVLNPRRKNWEMKPGIEQEQIEWEYRHLERADAILFWFPCETLCPITLYELGKWTIRARVLGKPLFIGCHPDYQRKNDIVIQTKLEWPELEIVFSLEDLAKKVLAWEPKKVA